MKDFDFLSSQYWPDDTSHAVLPPEQRGLHASTIALIAKAGLDTTYLVALKEDDPANNSDPNTMPINEKE